MLGTAQEALCGEMAHYAEINEKNEVVRVLVVSNDIFIDGQEYLANVCGLGGTWIQTSYNTYGGEHKLGGTPLHKNYAGIGYIFDGVGFAAPQPYPSWTLNQQSYLWEPPTPRPETGFWEWNEENLEWVLTTIS